MGNNKSKKIVGIVGATGLDKILFGVGLYLINPSKKSLKHKIKTKEEKQMHKLFQQEKRLLKEQKLKELIKDIKIEYDGPCLTMNSLISILDKAPDIAQEEFSRKTLKNRQLRRKYIETDLEKYHQIIMKYNEQVEQILEEAQMEVIKAINLSQQVFEQSIMKLMEDGNIQQFFLIQAGLRQKIKQKSFEINCRQSIESTKEVSLSQIKEILSFQIQILQSQPESFCVLIQKLQQDPDLLQLIPFMLNTQLADLIYQKFGFEEEDQLKRMNDPKILLDNEIQQKLMEIEKGMYALMEKQVPEEQNFEF